MAQGSRGPPSQLLHPTSLSNHTQRRYSLCCFYSQKTECRAVWRTPLKPARHTAFVFEMLKNKDRADRWLVKWQSCSSERPAAIVVMHHSTTKPG